MYVQVQNKIHMQIINTKLTNALRPRFEILKVTSYIGTFRFFYTHVELKPLLLLVLFLTKTKKQTKKKIMNKSIGYRHREKDREITQFYLIK